MVSMQKLEWIFYDAGKKGCCSWLYVHCSEPRSWTITITLLTSKPVYFMHTLLPQASIHEVKLFNLFLWNPRVRWPCIVAAWGIRGGSRRDGCPAHTEGTRTEAQAFQRGAHLNSVCGLNLSGGEWPDTAPSKDWNYFKRSRLTPCSCLWLCTSAHYRNSYRYKRGKRVGGSSSHDRWENIEVWNGSIQSKHLALEGD